MSAIIHRTSTLRTLGVVTATLLVLAPLATATAAPPTARDAAARATQPLPPALAPVVTTISPTVSDLPAGGRVHIHGFNLDSVRTVTFGGTTAWVDEATATDLTVLVPARAKAEGVPVTVTTAYGTSELAHAFRYVSAKPAIGSVSPPAGSLIGGVDVHLRGANFVGVREVRFGLVAAPFAVQSSSEIVAHVPPTMTPGTVDISVRTASGTTTAPAAFTYSAGKPTIATVVPSTGSVNGGTEVRISGAFMDFVTAVRFGTTQAAFRIVDGTTLVAIAPISMTDGPVDVAVSTPSGIAEASKAFTYAGSSSVVTSVTPSTGPVSAVVPGTTTKQSVVIGLRQMTSTGSCAATACVEEVRFGEQRAPFSIVKGRLVAQLPKASAPGPVDVTVVIDGTSSIAQGGFVYTASEPVLLGVNPATGSLAGGTAIALRGTNLPANVTSVLVGDRAARLSKDAKGHQVIVVPSGRASGPVDVTIVTDAGRSTLPGAFTYSNAPQVTSMHPAVANTGTQVARMTIRGTQLTTGTVVTIGGSTARVVEAGTGTITVQVPTRKDAGAVDVTLRNGSAVTTMKAAFAYQPAGPAIASLTPSQAEPGTTFQVVLEGTNLDHAASATIGGIKVNLAEPRAAADGTSLIGTMRIPAGTRPGLVDAVVTSDEDGKATTLKGAFTILSAELNLAMTLPPSLPANETSSVVFYGTAMSTVTSVTIGGQPARMLRSQGLAIDPQSLTVTFTSIVSPQPSNVPYAPFGGFGVPGQSTDVVLTALPSTKTFPGACVTADPVPQVTAVTPNVVTESGARITITVTDLVNPGAVYFSGHLVPFVTNADGTLSANTPIGLQLGTYAVVVGGQSASGRSVTAIVKNGFTMASPPPVVTEMIPREGPESGGTPVTLYLDQPANVSRIRFGSEEGGLMTLSDPPTDQPFVLAPPWTNESAVTVTVQTLGGPVVSPYLFRYVAPEGTAPSITGTSPASVYVNEATPMTIQGRALADATSVWIGTQSVPFTVTDAGYLAINVPARSTRDSFTITVATPNGSASKDILVLNRTFAIASATPTSGLTTGGTTITVTGTGMDEVTNVSFKGTSVLFRILSLSQITFISPAHADVEGVLVTVRTGAGASGSFTFTYQAPPPAPPTGLSITSIAPNNGSPFELTHVVITGTNLQNASSVTFGESGAFVETNTSTSLGVLAPAIGAPGPVTVTVTTPMGAATTTFTYNAQ